MPIDYEIDHDRRLVTATAHGTFTHEDVLGYQKEVWSRPDVNGYNELVDMSRVERIALPRIEGIRELASLSAGMDAPSRASRFAIVAPKAESYGLGRMYQTYRSLDDRSTKEVGVFRTMEEALAFLNEKDQFAGGSV